MVGTGGAAGEAMPGAAGEEGAQERWRILKNVAVISVAFMMHFTAYQGAANLQSSINATAGLGTASLAAVYVSLILSNLFLPVVMIKWLGCKWTVAISFVAYMPYIAAQFYPTFYTLIPAGLSVGFGGGPLWCAKCTYLTVVADAYSKISGIPSDVLVVRFFGVFFMIFQFSQVWGNLISSVVLSSGNNTLAVTALNASQIPELCGANFLPSADAGDALQSQPPGKIQAIAGVYLACMVAACLIVAFGVDSLKRYDKDRTGSGTGLSGLSLLAITLKLLKEPNQLLMMVITIWLGLSQAFMGADFTSAFVSCALGTGYVGYVMIAYGLANSASAMSTSYVVKLTGRPVVVASAAVLQTALIVTLLVWRPLTGQAAVLYAVAALWGVCDGVWLVQINAFCGILFPGREEAAYSNFRLWESLGFIVAYVASPHLLTAAKLQALLAGLLLGVAGYLLVELRVRTATRAAGARDYVENPDDASYPNFDRGCDNISFHKIE